MIIVKIHNGLGNQMFQYAFARTLQQKLKVKVLIDCRTHYGLDKSDRDYGLNSYNLKLREAKSINLAKFLSLREQGVKLADYNGLIKQFVRFWRKIFDIKFYGLYREKFNVKILNTENDPSLSNVISEIDTRNDYYISGYFQNNEYVDDILSILRKDFSLKNNYLFNTLLARKLQKENTVSIHVRRGDYINYPNLFPVMEMDYFTNAINNIMSKVNNPVFYIFSNDKEWVKRNFELGDKFHLVDECYSNNDCDDLFLMSMCNHQIISNSTYSWWSAKLNSSKNKLVIAPKQWYIDNEMNDKTVNFIDKDWIRI